MSGGFTGRGWPLEVVRLAGAAILGVALWRWAPLPPDDSLRGTLALAPVIIAALAWIARAGRAAGARRMPPALVAGQLAAALVAAAGAVGRHHLGLDGTAPVVAAALAALLALHAAGRLLALRPLLGRRLTRQKATGHPSLLFLALPFVAYLALIPWSADQRQPDGDEPWYLLVTHSLVHDFDADLTNNYQNEDWHAFIDRPLSPQQGDPRDRAGHLYSRHNALLPLLLAPAYALAGKLGALAVMALLTAALAWTTLLLGGHYFPERPGEVLAAYGLVAFTPPLLVYSYQVWVEVPAALLSMLALDRILRLRAARAEADPAARRRLWLMIALCLLLLPLVKLRFLLLAATLLFLAWWHGGRALKPALVTGGVLSLLGAAILLFNQVIYGNPLKIHTWEEVKLHERAAGDFLEGIPGLFFDSAFGLFASSPIWLLLLPAALLLLARRHRLLFDLTAFASLYFLVVAPRAEWYGGWSPPFRYALVILPLLGLMLVPLLEHRRRPAARALLVALAAATLALALLWIAVPGWTYNFANGRTYLLDHLGARLGADVARLFPSSVRPRAATWIWPPMALLVVTAWWWWPPWRPQWRLLRRGGNARRRPARASASALWGVAALLGCAALVPVLARALPTHVVELEDAQVMHRGGHPHPARWVNLRTSYRGAWVLREGEVLSAPVTPEPGARRVRLALDALYIQHRAGDTRITVLASGQPLATLTLDQPDVWRRIELGSFDWPAGATRIGIAVAARRGAGRLSGVALDRLELQWIE